MLEFILGINVHVSYTSAFILELNRTFIVTQ